MQGLHEDPGELELLSDCVREMEQPITDEKLQALPVQIPGLCMEKLLRLMNANQIPRLDHKRTLEKMEPDTRNPNMMCFDESFAKRRKFNTEFNREKQLIQDGILHKDWRLPPFFGPHPAVGTFFSTREALQLRKNRAAADAGEEPEHELPSLGNEKDAWGRDWYRHAELPKWVLPYHQKKLMCEQELIKDAHLAPKWREERDPLTEPMPAEGDFFTAEEATLLRNYTKLENFLEYCPHLLLEVKDAAAAMLHIKEVFTYGIIPREKGKKRDVLTATKLENMYTKLLQMPTVDQLAYELPGLKTIAADQLREWKGWVQATPTPSEEGKHIYIYYIHTLSNQPLALYTPAPSPSTHLHLQRRARSGLRRRRSR
jgi:hypothetical protein